MEDWRIEQLSAYLDGELDETERVSVERWLESNPDGRQSLAELRGLTEAVRGLPRAAAPEGLAERVEARLARLQLLETEPAAGRTVRIFRRLAVAAVLALAVGAGWMVRRGQLVVEPRYVVAPETTLAPVTPGAGADGPVGALTDASKPRLARNRNEAEPLSLAPSPGGAVQPLSDDQLAKLTPENLRLHPSLNLPEPGAGEPRGAMPLTVLASPGSALPTVAPQASTSVTTKESACMVCWPPESIETLFDELQRRKGTSAYREVTISRETAGGRAIFVEGWPSTVGNLLNEIQRNEHRISLWATGRIGEEPRWFEPLKNQADIQRFLFLWVLPVTMPATESFNVVGGTDLNGPIRLQISVSPTNPAGPGAATQSATDGR